jgi:hypothetical protein
MRAIRRSVRIPPTSAAIEQMKSDPKNVAPPLASDNELAQRKMATNAINAPRNAPRTTADRLLTALNQNAMNSEKGRASTKPRMSPINISLGDTGMIVRPPEKYFLFQYGSNYTAGLGTVTIS